MRARSTQPPPAAIYRVCRYIHFARWPMAALQDSTESSLDKLHSHREALFIFITAPIELRCCCCYYTALMRTRKSFSGAVYTLGRTLHIYAIINLASNEEKWPPTFLFAKLYFFFIYIRSRAIVEARCERRAVYSEIDTCAALSLSLYIDNFGR